MRSNIIFGDRILGMVDDVTSFFPDISYLTDSNSQENNLYIVRHKNFFLVAFMKYLLLYACLSLSIIQVSFAQKVISITVDGTINPVAADFIHNSIKKAADARAECL